MPSRSSSRARATAPRRPTTRSATAARLIVTYATYQISGTVFEDVNYGGGAGRNLATATGAGGTGRSGARVELFDNGGNYVAFTTTAAAGTYSFTGLAPGNYFVRVVNSSVTSARAGYVATLIPVQTFRTSATTGTAVAVTDHVGGEMPNKADAGNGSTTLAALTTATQTPQSIALATVGATDITGIDFGYSFNVVCNTNDAGQGSLRQFITNANALDHAGLALQGLPAATDQAVFMVFDGVVHPGLSATFPDQLTAGVAVIPLASALPAITSAMVIDGTLQTTWVGNTNTGSVGTGGTVGVDALPLGTYELPEVAINAGDFHGITINGAASDVRITA